MIPKIIHYCWFGKKDKPILMRNCIASWKRFLPDYKIIEWNEENFDLHSVEWVEKAYLDKKYAFVADYIRFHVLYNYGGIYLDTDVLIRKSFDSLLNYGFFSALEFPLNYDYIKQYNIADNEGNFFGSLDKPAHMCMCGILAAIMGAVKGHPLLLDCLNYYNENNYTKVDSSYINQSIVCDDIILWNLWKYGYKLKDEDQKLKHDIMIFNSRKFGGSLKYKNKDNMAIHLCSATWRTNSFKQKLKTIVKNTYILLYSFRS